MNKPTKRQVVDAIKILQQYMKGVHDTELVIGEGMLRVLPQDDEFDLSLPSDVIAIVEAYRTIQRFSGHFEDEEEPVEHVRHVPICG